MTISNDIGSATGNTTTRRAGLSRYAVPHQAFGWFTRGLGLTALACGAFLGAISWFFGYQVVQSLGLSDLATGPELVERYSQITLFSTVIIFVWSTVYITLVGGFLFHRVAGPIYRMHEHMKRVISGEEVSELQFRETDQLADVRDTYNQLLHYLEALEPKPMQETRADATRSEA